MPSYRIINGVLKKYAELPESQYNYAIFTYDKGEDIRKIEGQTPLVFQTLDELKEELNTIYDDDVEEGEVTIVLRKMTIYA